MYERWLLAGVLLTALSGCAPDLTKPAFNFNQRGWFADVAMTWSRDDRFIAYRRLIYSQDGPPGIYIVPSLGGKPRFITPASFYWPAELRFSPDGRKLVAVQDLYWIVTIDVATGEVTPLRYSENGPSSPDWSPDGRKIVSGVKYFLPGQPIDSIAIRILDVTTREETLLRHNGEFVYGGMTKWSPNGEWIVFHQGAGSSQKAMAVRPDGSDLRTLAQETPLLADLHWFERPAHGMRGVVYRRGTSASTFFASLEGGGLTPWKPYGVWDAFSFDGEHVVVTQIESRDSLALLFVRATDDWVSGASLRQLTFFEPAPIDPATSAPNLSDAVTVRNTSKDERRLP